MSEKKLNKNVRVHYPDSNHRTWMHMNSFGWELGMYDDIVQGRPLTDMVDECQKRVDEEQAKLDDPSYYTKSDRYGEVYPNYETARWGRERRDRYQSMLDNIVNGWRPKYVIHLVDGQWDPTTIEKWEDFCKE